MFDPFVITHEELIYMSSYNYLTLFYYQGEYADCKGNNS